MGDRILLYILVLALTIVLGYLALRVDQRLATMGTTITTIKDRLPGLEGRVADAVVNKLPAVECPPTSEGDECVPAAPAKSCPTSDVPEEHDCGDSPPSVTVKSKFTLLYENARLTESRDITENSVGVKLADRHRTRLDLLAKAFGPCHRSVAPVEFRVTGYASNAEFRLQPGGEPMPDSDELNLRTANLRAQIVGDHLENEGFNVETTRWLRKDDLRRPFREDTQPGIDQQALNRTVLIELVSAGACDLAP